MHPYVNTAVQAARKAGRMILRSFDDVENLKIITKAQNDFVTQVDHASEAIIIETLRRAYPDHAFFGEETGHSGDNHTTWIIDPLDGTTNFIHGFPHFCISIAAVHKGRVEHGVIYDPLRDELFTATRGEGARLNDKRLRVTDRPHLAESLLGTGFPVVNMEYLNAYLALFKNIVPQIAGLRRAGSAALDLAYVACGRMDGFWECHLKPWDIAAGALMIREAGGLTTDFGGELFDPFSETHIVAGNPKLHKELMNLIETHFK